MIDFGTVRPGTTLYIPFATYDSNDPSASVTLTGLATTDIEVYKNGSVTQRASDSGYALLDTDGIDFDGTTGIHGISIDLADNTTAGFWEAGAQYTVVIASITVDAATINFIAATFRIGYENAILNTSIATLASQTSFTLTAGPADNDALNGCTCIVHDVASAVQIAQALVLDYTGSTKTVTLAADPAIFTMAATDNISFFPANLQLPKALPDAAGGLPISDAGGLDLDAKIGALTFTVAGDVDVNVQTWGGTAISTPPAVNATQISGDGTAADTLELFAEALDQATGQLDSGSLAAGTITAAAIADGAIDAATFAADVDAEILSYIVDDATRIDASQLNTHSAITVAGIADGVWDEAQADHVAAGSFGLIASEIADILVDTAEIGAAGAGLTVLATAAELAKVPKSDGTASWNATALAAINAQVDTAFTTQMADSVSADGSIATREQALYMILQLLTDFTISGTTLTVRKVDGSTSLFTLTLDDATNPTGATR